VFTPQYRLSPYITLIRFILKGLIYNSDTNVCVWCITCYKTVSPIGDYHGQINLNNFPNWVAEKISWFCLV
jgi:hypothetical protein